MKKLKKTLRGYSPVAVRQFLNELQENHRIRMKELQEQAKLMAAEQERMTAELERLMLVEKKQPTIMSDQIVAKRLLEAHQEQSGTIFQILQELNTLDNQLRAVEGDKQAERDQILEQVERRLKEALNQMGEGRGMT
jgi:cell division septum initiation protein DivIVA